MDDEIMVTGTEVTEAENYDTESSGNGLKTVGILALTAAIGTGLFFGAKKIVKKIKAKKEAKYIKTFSEEPLATNDEE